LGAALRGDLGYSIRTREGVVEAIIARLPVTLELVILSQLITVVLAVPLGVLSAFRNGRLIDRVIGSSAFAMISIPNFVFALLLIFFFSLRLGWFPATGYVPISEDFWGNLHAMILPALSLALVEWVALMRVLRSDMISVLQEDYIAMARAKGLPTGHILFRHALRPASFTLITILGLQIGTVLGGSLIIEQIFALPGLGRLLVSNIYARDFMMVQGCILFIAVVYVLINFAVDLLYSVLDPRIRVEGGRG
jgi:peptide/nickel transport system permease protein